MMDFVIPYTKEITFKTKIAEIYSISLEHEMDINESEILGNFIVSGEYKTHELSMNKEPFEFTLPFSIDIADNIDKDSIIFEITDFTYEILKNDTLKIIIELSLKGTEIKKEAAEEEREMILEKIEEQEEIFIKPEEKIEEITEIELPIEEKIDAIVTEKTEEDDTQINHSLDERNDDMLQEENTIIESINTNDDTYQTYHVHIVKENENIEAICTMYNSNMSILANYNDVSEIKLGDKLIIPEEDNE
ncbi:MAG: LysM peptidoglycan-binding domain-containing protein [Bacilli bacterium]|nr:LysM peptidoglycan-binding domain-containing protein [Bacilli bacterium]